MKYFSFKQRSHLLEAPLYEIARFKVFTKFCCVVTSLIVVGRMTGQSCKVFYPQAHLTLFNFMF